MTTPRVRSVRRAQCWLNVRKDSPIRVPPAQSFTVSATRASARSRSRSRSSRVTRVSRVPNTNDSVRTSLRRRRAPGRTAAAAASGAPSSREMSQMHDERPRLADRPPPDPRQDLAAGPEVAPEHRPRREPAAVRVQLVAAGPALLQPRHEQVDEPLRVAQLGRRHPVELAVAEHLARAVRVGRDDDALDRRLVVGVVVAGRGIGMPRSSGARVRRSSPGSARPRRRRPLVGRRRSGRSIGGGSKSRRAARPRRRHQRSKTAS